MIKYLLLVLLTFNTFAETDKVISTKELTSLSAKHEKYLKTSLNQLEKEILKAKSIQQKVGLIDLYKKEIHKYFFENDEQMVTEFRIEYRSLMDLYLTSIPNSKMYSKKDCTTYKIQFEQGAGSDPTYFSWSAVVVDKFLNDICK